MMWVGQTHTCRDLFRRLDILPIPCVYLFSLMKFVVNNLNLCVWYGPQKGGPLSLILNTSVFLSKRGILFRY
jgi:hypothetical protein